MIEILYFARLRERVGVGRESLELPAGLATAADLMAHLQSRGTPWAEALGGDERILVAVNQTLASPQSPIRDGDEVAFFPPVTGG